LPSYFAAVSKLSQEEEKAINEALCRTMACDNMPCNLMDSDYFRQFIFLVSRGMYPLPGRTKSTELIDAYALKVKEKVACMLSRASSVSITSDAALLPSRDNYVAVTGHWIGDGTILLPDGKTEKTWRLYSAVLGVAISNVSHTADEIAALVNKVTNVDFMLDDRLDAMTTDNGANFKAAVAKLIENGVLEEDARCACHTIQLSIKASYEQVGSNAKALVDGIRSYVINITNNPLKMSALREKQKNPDALHWFEEEAEAAAAGGGIGAPLSAPDPFQSKALKLQKDINTRWNSAFYMMRRFVELRREVQYVINQFNLAHDPDVSYNMTDRAWRAAVQLERLLQPFQVATDLFQGEKYPTLAYVSRIIPHLIECLSADRAPAYWRVDVELPAHGVAEEGPPPAEGPLWASLEVEVLEVRNFIRADLVRRWTGDSSAGQRMLMDMAAALHPAHKNLQDFLPAARVAEVYAQLRLEALAVEGIAADDDEDDAPPAAAAPPPAAAPPVHAQRRAFNQLFGPRQAHAQPAVSERQRRIQSIEAQIHKYRLEEPIDFNDPRDPAQDPLRKWAEWEPKYPTLAKLAKKYLAIPASSAPSERVFSAAAIILKKQSTRMLPERVEKRLFVKYNEKLLSQ
jgi:hypothetical protein